jgi:hypothetical protein
MNLDDWKIEQQKELMDWAARLDGLPKPTDAEFCPDHIKGFPKAVEKATKLRQICRVQVAHFKLEMQKWEDTYLTQIEQEQTVMQRGGVNKLPRVVAKYSSEEKRQRELRRRLAEDEAYQDFRIELETWETLRDDWAAHIDRLRRELRLAEIDYASSGGGA